MEITAAVVEETGGSFDLKKLSLDEPRPDEVLVKIVATGNLSHRHRCKKKFFRNAGFFSCCTWT